MAYKFGYNYIGIDLSRKQIEGYKMILQIK